jgi:hypothetical protein
VSTPDPLAADLAALSASLDDPSIDIAQSVRQLSHDVGQAVASYLGLSVQAFTGGQTARFTVGNDGADLARSTTSLRMSLTSTAGTDDAAHIILIYYASVPGAFVDLAADLQWLSGGDQSRLVLDGDLPAVVGDDPGFGGISAINQAIGVLLGRGHSKQSARAELVRLAGGDHARLALAAAALLAALDD